MLVRDRIRELRRVRASELRPSSRNWRSHPKAQQDALRGLLAEVGYAGALIARELPDGSLELIDGHLRAETTPDSLVPVLVLDVDEAEAAKLLASMDPLAAMAGADAQKLDSLLREVDTGSEALASMLTGLADSAGVAGAADEVRPLDVLAPPVMTWILIGIPTLRFVEIAADVERIATLPAVLCEVVANDDDQSQDGQPLPSGET